MRRARAVSLAIAGVLGGALAAAVGGCSTVLGFQPGTLDDGTGKIPCTGSFVTTSECGQNGEQSCLYGTCTKSCNGDPDCPTGYRCVIARGAGAPYGSCVDSSIALCGSGCDGTDVTCAPDGACRSNCSTSSGSGSNGNGPPSNCLGGQTCRNNVCYGNDPAHDPPRSADGGAGDAGTPAATEKWLIWQPAPTSRAFVTDRGCGNPRPLCAAATGNDCRPMAFSPGGTQVVVASTQTSGLQYGSALSTVDVTGSGGMKPIGNGNFAAWVDDASIAYVTAPAAACAANRSIDIFANGTTTTILPNAKDVGTPLLATSTRLVVGFVDCLGAADLRIYSATGGAQATPTWAVGKVRVYPFGVLADGSGFLAQLSTTVTRVDWAGTRTDLPPLPFPVGDGGCATVRRLGKSGTFYCSDGGQAGVYHAVKLDGTAGERINCVIEGTAGTLVDAVVP